MKITDVILENKDRLSKKIEKLNQDIQLAIEKGDTPPKKTQKELDRLVAAFPEWADYQADKMSAARIAGHGDMMARVKTAKFKAGTSKNYISAEAGSLAVVLEMLRDVAPFLDDDIANVLSSFNTKARNKIRPTNEETELAKAVVARAEELGVLDNYRARVVTKLEKHEKKYSAYDDEDGEDADD